MNERYPWLWDTDMDNATFQSLLQGDRSQPPHDTPWAMARLIDYAPYHEIRRLLSRDQFLRDWSIVEPRVRSRTRRQGMNFIYQRWRQKAAGNE